MIKKKTARILKQKKLRVIFELDISTWTTTKVNNAFTLTTNKKYFLRRKFRFIFHTENNKTILLIMWTYGLIYITMITNNFAFNGI